MFDYIQTQLLNYELKEFISVMKSSLNDFYLYTLFFLLKM